MSIDEISQVKSSSIGRDCEPRVRGLGGWGGWRTLSVLPRIGCPTLLAKREGGVVESLGEE